MADFYDPYTSYTIDVSDTPTPSTVDNDHEYQHQHFPPITYLNRIAGSFRPPSIYDQHEHAFVSGSGPSPESMRLSSDWRGSNTSASIHTNRQCPYIDASCSCSRSIALRAPYPYTDLERENAALRHRISTLEAENADRGYGHGFDVMETNSSIEHITYVDVRESRYTEGNEDIEELWNWVSERVTAIIERHGSQLDRVRVKVAAILKPEVEGRQDRETQVKHEVDRYALGRIGQQRSRRG